MRKIVAALLLSCFLAAPVAAQEQQKTDWGIGAAYISLAAVTVADIDTTGRAIERGLVEKNPLYKPFSDKPGMLGLVNGAVTGGVSLATHHFLFKKGKKKEAKIVIWAWTAVRAAVVVHNIKQLNK